VINCDEPFAERFLEKYSRTWPRRVRLTRLDLAGSETIFEPLPPEERAWFTELERACAELLPARQFVARVSKFLPEELPAVMTETRDSRNRREMAQVASHLAVPAYLRRLVQGSSRTSPSSSPCT